MAFLITKQYKSKDLWQKALYLALEVGASMCKQARYLMYKAYSLKIHVYHKILQFIYP